MFSISGNVQYIGGCSTHVHWRNVIKMLVDILSTLGDILSTSGDIMIHAGEYHEYIGGRSVHQLISLFMWGAS